MRRGKHMPVIRMTLIEGYDHETRRALATRSTAHAASSPTVSL